MPQYGLKSIQASAETANIEPVSTSLNPKSLAKGGIVINTTDWPAPTKNRPPDNNQIIEGSLFILKIKFKNQILRF